jgi:nitrogen fixation-related uncharacterized protein
MAQAEKVGAKITDPAHDRFWGGYSGYFQDLDGHLWEIAWDPSLEIKEQNEWRIKFNHDENISLNFSKLTYGFRYQ